MVISITILLLLFLLSFVVGVAAGSAIGWPLSGIDPRSAILKKFRRLPFDDQRDLLARLDMELMWPD
jgi:hypothetical protein